MAIYCFINNCKSHCSAIRSHLQFLSLRGVCPASNKDSGSLLVQNAEEVIEILGIKRIKVKENINGWLINTA